MFNLCLCNAANIRYSQLKFGHMHLCGMDYKYFSPHCCNCNSFGCTAAIRCGNACRGPHIDSLYSGSEHSQFNSPRLVKREAGFPNPRRALIGSNQLWRVNDSPYYREYSRTRNSAVLLVRPPTFCRLCNKNVVILFEFQTDNRMILIKFRLINHKCIWSENVCQIVRILIDLPMLYAAKTMKQCSGWNCQPLQSRSQNRMFVHSIIILSRSQQFPTSSSQNQVELGEWASGHSMHWQWGPNLEYGALWSDVTIISWLIRDFSVNTKWNLMISSKNTEENFYDLMG